MALTPGTRLGVFELIEEIGRGGMGEVYRARDTKLDRDVAIKVLPEAFAHDGERLARFLREAKTLASLNHPNIAIIHGLEESGGVCALVMELVEGDDLSQRIARGAIPLDEALPVAKQIAEALEAAHEQRIIHRDLKPANIKVRPDGMVKVLDFGLAKAIEPTGVMAVSSSMAPTINTPALMTGTGMILGTAAYMSPEQARGKTVDKRADIWAFGAVVFEMLTGKRPFGGEDVTEVIGAVVRLEPRWEALPSDLPPPVRTLLQSCLVKDPRRRVADISTALFVLDKAASLAAAPVAETLEHAGGRLSASWTRVALIGTATLALGAVLGVGVWFYTRPVAGEARLIRFEMSPPEAWRTNLSGDIPIAVSPDGRSVAGSARNDRGQRALWVRTLDTLDARILSGTENVTSLFWSPDSRALAFFSDGKLKTVDVASGAATVLCDAAQFSLGGTWGPTGVILFGSATGLQQVPSTGGTPTTALTLAPDEAFHSLPVFLPDGEHFVFVAAIGDEVRGGARRRVLAARLGSQERTLLFDADRYVSPVGVASGHLVFVRGTSVMAQPFDDTQLALSGDAVSVVDRVQLIPNRPYGMVSVGGGVLAYVPEVDTNTHQLAWYDRSGRQTALVGDRGNYANLELSPDETRAVLAVMDPARRTRDIWLFEMTRAIRTRFTFEAGEERTAIWSPNADRLIFNSQRTGTERDLYMKASNGSGTESTVLVDGLSKDAMSWSPDGGRLLYRVSAKTRNDIWVQPLDGRGKPYPFLATEFDENYARFSPDGRWVVYSSDESGRWEVYVAPSPGPGGKWQLSTAGGSLPRWRQDGREVFYLAPDNTVMSVTVDGATSGFQVDTVRPLFHAPMPPQVGYQYAVTRDGQRFLINTAAEPAAPVVVIDGWSALLRK